MKLLFLVGSRRLDESTLKRKQDKNKRQGKLEIQLSGPEVLS